MTSCNTEGVYVEDMPLDDAVDGTRRRAAQATGLLVVGASLVAVVAAGFHVQLALLPVAFILGWLNLVGL